MMVMRDDDALVAAIRDLVAAMALQRAYDLAGGSLCRCGHPMTRYDDCGEPFCDEHGPAKQTESTRAPMIRRMMKAARVNR